jgi:branched-chain amino acid transport system substrate-binding protein
MQGQAAARFAFQQLGVTKVATIDDGDPYTQGLTTVFSQEFTELGGEIVLATAVNKGDTNMRPMLTGVVMSGAELVFLPIFPPESSFIVLQAKEVEGAEDIILMSADGSLTSVFVNTAGRASVGMYFIKLGTPEGSAYDTFFSTYETKYGEAPINTLYAPHVYDATNLVLQAIETVAVQEKDGTLHIGRQALREALAATAEYHGLTGSLTCDKFGDCGIPRYKVVRLDDLAAGIEGLWNNVVYSYSPEQGRK